MLYTGEKDTDLLQRCAAVFERLIGCQYRFTLGRKGKQKEIVLGFRETDFHHLAGLHKLRDISIASENRQTVFRDILAGRITYRTIEKSVFVDESRLRLEMFQFIEDLPDGEQDRGSRSPPRLKARRYGQIPVWSSRPPALTPHSRPASPCPRSSVPEE